MSDTQHDEAVAMAELEAEADRERREARELAYHEVSLRAVELLASAQKAADEAVAEAQSYARDLEETAREQYRHILQRAHDAARAAGGGAPEPSSGTEAAPDAHGGLEARELEYVRTYARVAHTQLKAVLGALNDELDRLAELAEPPVQGEVVQHDGADGHDDDWAGEGSEHEGGSDRHS